MPHRHLIRSGVLDGFVELVAEFGLDAQALLLEAGIPASALEEPDSKFLSLAFRRLLHLSALRSGRPHFGLLLAERQHLSALGPLGAAVAGARTVGHAFELVNNYVHLSGQATVSRLDVSGGTAVWTYVNLLPADPGAREVEDYSVALMLKILRHLTRPHWSPSFVSLPRSTPSDPLPYRKYFGCEVRFGAELPQVEFDAALLARKNSAANWHVAEVLEDYLRGLAASDPLEIGPRVQRIIAKSIPHGVCSLEQAARVLAKSPRSLQRELAAASTSFQAELDAVRLDLARQYLQEGQMPLTVLADVLRYSDLASFSRAFKKAEGISPLAWRRLHRRTP